MKPQKIFELKGEDFAKGLSYKSSFPVGGIWGSSSSFDPFEDYGYLITSLDYSNINTSTDTPITITNWNESGTAKLYVHTATKLREVLAGSPYTASDESAEIDVTSPVTGAILFQGRYIYAQATAIEIFSNTLPVASASNVRIFNSGGSNTQWYTPMCVGADKNLYFAHGDIGKITNVTSADAGVIAYNLEGNMYARDLINDGKYLVVVADNNTSNQVGATPATGSYRCQVYFFDVNNGRSTADYIYEFTDSYVTSVRFLDGVVYIFGKDNLWACNSVTPPKVVFSFNSTSTITEPPKTPFQVTQNTNSLFWCGVTNQKIYAFGSLVSGMKKIFYQPYSVGHTPSAITTNGTKFYVGTSGANDMLSILNTGSTRTLTSSQTASIFLPQPYRFAFAKVIMKSKLASGGQVYLGVTNNDGNISFATTKLYSTIGAKQSIIFNLENDTTASVKEFNDFKLAVGSNQTIAKVELWAYPVENYEQSI
ncbi:hypothetical protein M0R04_14160 [Candidatus Dojkabacteria bacterium]|jgi:hypothetical protein|nr:hypothetical protein [Candidatus Dojkabacteria bacterium]